MQENENAVISIGNSDNKLTQQRWSNFVEECAAVVAVYAKQIHFFGGSSTFDSWQNVAWIIEIEKDDEYGLRHDLEDVRKEYNQDSAFLLLGKGDLV